jgi:acyl-CoA synthetase (AMP-forming)/AMP-acid ligase II
VGRGTSRDGLSLARAGTTARHPRPDYFPIRLQPTDPPHIVAYKKPRSVDIVADLPKNVSDQSRKRELRERYWQGLERRV